MTELEELRLAYAECSRQRNELLTKLKQHQPVQLSDEEIRMLIPDGNGWKYEVGFDEAIEFARAVIAAYEAKQGGGV